MTSRFQDTAPRRNADDDAIEVAPPRSTYMPLHRDTTPLDNIDEDEILPNPHRDATFSPFRDESPLNDHVQEPVRARSPPGSPQQDDPEANNPPAASRQRREPVRACGMRGSTILILMGITGVPLVFFLWLGIPQYIKWKKAKHDAGDVPNNETLYF